MSLASSSHGTRFLQANITTPWYLSFRCLSLREKELKRNKYQLAIVKSAESKSIIIPPNSEVVIQGYLDKQLPYQPVCALLQPTEKSTIHSDLDIAPILTSYSYQNNGAIPVCISNITSRTATITPKAILCELQPVTITDLPSVESVIKEEHKKDEFNIPKDDLTTDQLHRLQELLKKYKNLFSTGDTDIGHVTSVKHRIELTDHTPFKQKHRRISPALIEEVRNHLQQLLSAGVIRKSHSPWASNIIICRKKDSSIRMCIDYRQLNQRTVKDSYALPRIEEILDSLGGNCYFTVLDMKSGYHQIEIHEAHKQRTAFTVGPLGFFEFNRLPFGLVNAPASYQRLMEECLGDLNMKICFIYLDDLIIFSKTFDEHLEHLEQVFQRLQEANLKLSTKKCDFLKKKVKFVGHIVSEAGIEPDPDKIEAVLNWPKPDNPEKVRRFLGFI